MQHPLIIAICGSLLCATPLSATESKATGPAGYIESFTCTSADYELIRQSKPLPAEEVKFLMRLYTDDQVKIKNRTCEMTLRVGEINIVHLDADHLSYTVTEMKQPPTLSDNLWDTLKQGINYLLYGEGETPSRTVSIRGPKDELLQALVIPFLQTDGARLVAGDGRTMNLLWEGGLPPYRVRVYQGESKSPELENAKEMTRQIQLAPHSFKDGQTYRIRVESLPESNCKAQLSESQCVATGHFTVVASTQLPAMPPELQQSALTEEQKQTLFAAWLLHPDRHYRVTWGLEAYQRVAAGQDEFSKWVASHGKW